MRLPAIVEANVEDVRVVLENYKDIDVSGPPGLAVVLPPRCCCSHPPHRAGLSQPMKTLECGRTLQCATREDETGRDAQVDLHAGATADKSPTHFPNNGIPTHVATPSVWQLRVKNNVSMLHQAVSCLTEADPSCPRTVLPQSLRSVWGIRSSLRAPPVGPAKQASLSGMERH